VTDKLSYCGDLVRHNDPDRFLTCLFAPAQCREALFALYAFNFEIAKTRETVREPMMGRIRLQWWREAIAELYDGKAREHQVVRALAPCLPAAVDQEMVQRLIDARELDLEDTPPATGAALVDYTRATGGNLMVMAARLLGARDESLMQRAVDVGEAVAVAGLLRAIPFHAAQNRTYLPADLLRQMGVDASEIRASPTLGVDVVTYLMATEAERLLKADSSRIDRRYIAAYLPGTLAGMYLKRLERLAHDPFDPRNMAPFPQKPVGLAMAWMMQKT
jgi:phytoene synthase